MFCFVTFVTLAVAFSSVNGFLDFTAKTIEFKVNANGYPIEVHRIETEDGFILQYHRVPHGKKGPTRSHQHPVLLAHGLSQSSEIWLNDGGLAYVLVDAGFDVWLMNARGNKYSRKHKTYQPRWNEEYWDFSFDEMGRYDLPAAISHILGVTGRPTLSYVGFSMGNTMFWVMADSCDDCVSKVDTMVAIGPMARISGMQIFKDESFFNDSIDAIKTLKKLRKYASKPVNKILHFVNPHLPGSAVVGEKGLSTPFIFTDASIKTVEHYLQIGKQKSFQQFDYGEEGNREHYDGSPTPPVYDLRKVTCPVFFINSEKDDFSIKEDVEWLEDQLPTKPTFLFYEEVCYLEGHFYFFTKPVQMTLYKRFADFMMERKQIVYGVKPSPSKTRYF